MSTYEPHAVIVAYSIIDRASYHEAEKILNYLWKMSYNETKGIILVANKIDLERSRVISHEGKYMSVFMALSYNFTPGYHPNIFISIYDNAMKRSI